MTIWLDAHFGPELALWISSSYGIACRTLTETGLVEATDDQIFEAAKRSSSIVILTKDADFAELVNRVGPPPQVIWLRCPNLRTIGLQKVLQPHLAGAMDGINSGSPLVEIVISAKE